MKLNDLSESRKMLKLLKENRQDPRPPRSYSEFSKSPKDKKHSFEKPSNITQQNMQNSALMNFQETLYLYTWGYHQINYFLGLNSQAQTFSQSGYAKMTRANVDQQGVITSSASGILSCAAGESHQFFSNTKGEVYAQGSNQFGQLGLENSNSTFIKPTIVPSIRDHKASHIICGAEHTFMLTSKGEVYSWGLNIKGQLGLGCYDNVTTPTLVYSLLPFGSSNGRAAGHKRMKSDNLDQSPLKERSSSIDNIMEQIILMKEKFKPKNPKPTAEITTQILLSTDEVVTNVSCGALHTLVLTSKNRLLACGFGEGFALGTDDQSTTAEFKQVNVRSKQKASPRSEKIEKIACGLAHSGCIIEGRPYVWGMMGQKEGLIFKQATQICLNQDDITNHMNLDSFVVIDMKMGECFTLFLTSRGEVYSMGENIEGQLGLEGVVFSESPQKVSGIPLISQIAAGRNHCLSLSADLKQLYGWGANSYGQLNGSSKGSSPVQSPQFLFAFQSEVSKIVCGSFSTLMLANSNFEIQVTQDENENAQFVQEENNYRKSTKNLQENQQLKQDVQNLNEELEKLKLDCDQLRLFNSQLMQKVEKLKLDLQSNSKKKNANDLSQLKKSVDQKTQTIDSFLVDQSLKKINMIIYIEKGSSSNIRKQASKFDITALEVSPERPIKYRIFNTSLDIDFSEITLEKQISEGGYGIIYKAKWRESIVALKMFKIEGMNENHIRDFLSECHAMEALRHPNIVMFLGACTKPPNLAIVLEYCSRGSLWSVIQNHDIHLSWEDRRKMALDAARGVYYLHCFQPPILHRDLKSLNLLLDDALRIKLADFGWTRTMANYMTSKIGTYQWMAPEVIGGQTYTEKADVFSYGIILWEIASREPPYKNITGLQVSIEVLNNDFRPTIPKKTPENFARLMKRCWDRDPEKRPSFKEIIKELEIMKFPQQAI